MSTALITGAAGQDGTILAAQLAQQGIEAIGVVKPGTDASQLLKQAPGTVVVECDLEDTDALRTTVIDAAPRSIYNLAGFTAPGESWDHQETVRRINVDAVAAILDVMRTDLPESRMFQAASAHIFEGTDRSPQDEDFELTPQSPYAVSKADALNLVRDARAQGLFTVCGIMYNHESPLRTENFVTRRITKAVARIAAGQQEVLELGDIEVARDWGWAPDYVRAMQLSLTAAAPSDYILATGISHRLSYFLTKAFTAAGLKDWHERVISTTDRTRLADTNRMVGDPSRAYGQLGWRHTVDFDSMVRIMVEHDMKLLKDSNARWDIAPSAFNETTITGG